MFEQFCLDANVFIEAWNRYYSIEIAPSFWETLIQWSQEGRVFSLMVVYEEIARGKDELAQWCRDKAKSLFVDHTVGEVPRIYGKMANEIMQKYEKSKADEFLAGADLWLIAYAKVHNAVVVTQEAPSGKLDVGKDGKIGSKVKIPDVCRAFEVECIDTFEMLRRLKFQFR